MDIQGIASRPSAQGGGSVTTTTPNLTGAPSARYEADAVSGMVDAPASTQNISGEGLFMRLMQVYETRHPTEAREFLQGVADRLRADAALLGDFAPSVQAWGDRFQRAADTGDLSNLLPSSQPPPVHFGALAYQRASQPPTAAVPPEVEAAINDTLPPALIAEGLDPSTSGLEPAVFDPNVVAPNDLNAALGGLDLEAVDASIAAANQTSAELYDLAGSALPNLADALDLTPAAADSGTGVSANLAVNQANQRAALLSTAFPSPAVTPTLGQPLIPDVSDSPADSGGIVTPQPTNAAPSVPNAVSWTSPDLNTR